MLMLNITFKRSRAAQTCLKSISIAGNIGNECIAMLSSLKLRIYAFLGAFVITM